MDGNMDITSGSDLITVSWCAFDYTDLSYNHSLSNLVSGNKGVDEDNLNITWAYCKWGNGCLNRLPWVHFGTNHILNCLYDCPKATCIRASEGAKLRVENCDFNQKVKHIYSDTGADALTWTGNVHPGHQRPSDLGSVDIGYRYESMPTIDVIPVIGNAATGAGATLQYPFTRDLASFPASLSDIVTYSGVPVTRSVNVSAFREDADNSPCVVTAPDGILLSTDGSEWCQELILPPIESRGVIGINCEILAKISIESTGLYAEQIHVSWRNDEIFIPVNASVETLGDHYGTVILMWPLDKGDADGCQAIGSSNSAIASAICTVGNALYTKGTVTPAGNHALTRFNPYEALPKYRVEDANVSFSVIPEDGYIFIPTSLSFDASRVATNMAAIDVVVYRNGSETVLLKDVQPERDSSSPQGFTTYNLDLTSVPNGCEMTACIYMYNLSANKQIALGNICIIGESFSPEAGISEILRDSESPKTLYDLRGIPVIHPIPNSIYINPGDTNPKMMLRR